MYTLKCNLSVYLLLLHKGQKVGIVNNDTRDQTGFLNL